MTPGEALYIAFNKSAVMPEWAGAFESTRARYNKGAQAAIDAHEASQWRLESDRPDSPRMVCLEYDGGIYAGKRRGEFWVLCNGVGVLRVPGKDVVRWRELPSALNK